MLENGQIIFPGLAIIAKVRQRRLKNATAPPNIQYSEIRKLKIIVLFKLSILTCVDVVCKCGWPPIAPILMVIFCIVCWMDDFYSYFDSKRNPKFRSTDSIRPTKKAVENWPIVITFRLRSGLMMRYTHWNRSNVAPKRHWNRYYQNVYDVNICMSRLRPWRRWHWQQTQTRYQTAEIITLFFNSLSYGLWLNRRKKMKYTQVKQLTIISLRMAIIMMLRWRTQ